MFYYIIYIIARVTSEISRYGESRVPSRDNCVIPEQYPTSQSQQAHIRTFFNILIFLEQTEIFWYTEKYLEIYRILGFVLSYNFLPCTTKGWKATNMQTLYLSWAKRLKHHNIHALAAVDWGQVELLGTPLSDMTRNDDQLTFLDVEGLSLPFKNAFDSFRCPPVPTT